jgi:hypothetical protein
MHVDAARAAERRATALFGVTISLNSRHESEQVVPVPDRQRQVGDLDLRDDSPERRLTRFEDRRRSGDTDRFGEVADFERHVDAGSLSDLEGDRL